MLPSPSTSASQPLPTPSKLAAFILLSLLTVNVYAALPKVDFARMGTVGLTGSFAGLDIFDPSRNSTTLDSSTSTLLARAADGSLTALGSTSGNGRISAACSLNGKLYVAGSFSNVGGTTAQNIAAYNLQSRTFSALGGEGGGVNGSVSALYCDTKANVVWVGGSFKAPIGAPTAAYGGAVALYKPTDNSWSPPPFVGLTGVSANVRSIVPSASSTSLLFSGSFLTSFASNNSIQGIFNPNVPVSSGATPFTSSLVPVPIAGAELNAAPSSSSADFNDITKILCPAGADGPGNSWRGADGISSIITVRTFRFIPVAGIRLGNSFVDGHSTKSFSMITIPDNTVVQLTYIDPITKQNTTCSNPCPLSNDSSVPYQDFLFDTPDVVTGFQIKIEEWNGSSAGLHLLQLLSDGAFASSISEENKSSCFAPNPSSSATSGQWDRTNVFTGISGTTQDVLVSTVAVGTASSAAPSLTWRTYLSASGVYDVYVLIPGCENMQDCSSRTSAKVTVTPGGNLQPVTATVSEQVISDTKQLVYSGPIFPATPEFVSTISLTLADQPTGTGVNGQYRLVAGQVQYVLTSSNATGSGLPGGLGGSGTPGFGFYEWPLTSSSETVNATAILPNTTLTSLDDLALDLHTAIGATNISSTSFSINAIVPQTNDAVIFAGAFTLPSVSGASNFAAFTGGRIVRVNEGGLNGVVNALVASGDKSKIWAGGAFTDTVDGNGQQRYRGVVQYDPASQKWSPLGGGVDGVVTDLSLSKDGKFLSVAGNFTSAISSSTSTSVVGGFATWDITTGGWVHSGGFLRGSLTMTEVTGDAGSHYLAGNLQALRQFGADGWVLLENGGTDGAAVKVKSTGVRLGNVVAPPSTPPAARARRSQASAFHWFVPRFISASSSLFSKRQTPITALPPYPPTPAPAVLTGAFWTNTSSSSQVVVLGGNFSVPSTSSAKGVAFYDTKSLTLSPLRGPQVNGTVRDLYISGDTLFVGGQFSLAVGGDASSTLNGLAMYDLVKQQWITNGSAQGLQGPSVVVRSVTSAKSVPNTLIVAGTFTSAGSLPCEAVCSWNNQDKQWRSLGSGVRGEIASVDYAGPDSDTLVVGGALTLSDGTPANVAMYSFQNLTWKAIGSTPGPVTAIGVNNGNSSSIFAAGKTADGSSTFLIHWDGTAWAPMGESWEGSTTVSQLRLVPLQNQHSAQGVIQNDRALMIAGSLRSTSQGASSVTLYDGQTFYPYITSTAADGSPGLVSSLFHSLASFSFSQKRFLATGIVILISIAIAAGIVFLLLLIGVLWTICARRDAAPTRLPDDDSDEDSSLRHGRPSSLLEHINAATRTTIVGGALTGATSPSRQGSERDAPATSTAVDRDPDASGWQRSETPNDGLASGMDGEPDDVNRPTQARYSFDAREEGELPLSSGADVLVLNDRDPSWWYVRDVQSGREGVVPSSYLY